MNSSEEFLRFLKKINQEGNNYEELVKIDENYFRKHDCSCEEFLNWVGAAFMVSETEHKFISKYKKQFLIWLKLQE